MTNEDLMEIDVPNNEMDDDIENESASKNITIKELEKPFKMLENVNGDG